MCFSCKEPIIGNFIEKHSKLCIQKLFKLYGKFLKRTSSGFECTICGSRRNFRYDMYEHIERKHGRTETFLRNDKSQENCSRCGKVFLGSNSLKLHQETSKDCDCFKCGLKFCRRKDLLLHMASDHAVTKSKGPISKDEQESAKIKPSNEVVEIIDFNGLVQKVAIEKGGSKAIPEVEENTDIIQNLANDSASTDVIEIGTQGESIGQSQSSVHPDGVHENNCHEKDKKIIKYMCIYCDKKFDSDKEVKIHQKECKKIPNSEPAAKSSKGNTGKSLSEALIFASTNPKYDDRLFIELQVQYRKIPS